MTKKNNKRRKEAKKKSAGRRLPDGIRISVPAVKIKVVGVGGAGGNIISRMSKDFGRGVEFIAINTDAQDLDCCLARKKINIGRNLTKGMGTGMNPDLGRQAAEENRSDITEALDGADLVFLAAGMGGGTGTGAMPVVAEVAREIGALTVAVITKPFFFEGSQRNRIAEEGMLKLKDRVDSLIVVPNDRIFGVISSDTSLMKAFIKIDEILKNTVKGISEIISSAGLINVDFADVKTIMANAGLALVGVGQAAGKGRAGKAAAQAISSPLLEFSIDGAKGVLFGVSGGSDLKMAEVNEAAKVVTENVDPGARIIFGAYFDRKLKPGQIKISLIATGFNGLARENPLNLLFSQRGGVFAERSAEKEPNADKETATKEEEAAKIAKKQEELLEIPAFLRKKKR